jgi:signal recognition particle subunit SRP54
MRDVRLALLEADVSYKVVKDFISRVGERAVGRDVLERSDSRPDGHKNRQRRADRDDGPRKRKITISSKPPTIVMFVGLQGAGKTTKGLSSPLSLKKAVKGRFLSPATYIDRQL